MKDCIFCQIVSGKLETDIVKKSKNVVAFNDVNPKARVHILVVPREHLDTFLSIKNEHAWLLQEMVEIVQNIIKEKNIESAYRVVFNGGKYQHIYLKGQRFIWQLH